VSLTYLSAPQITPATTTSLEPSNRLAAQTWRAVDELFYDRTFNKEDWFQLRQQVVKRSYANEGEVYQALDTMIAKLGDKYTRFLTPAQYSALLNSAVGQLVGIGVELTNSEDKNIAGVPVPRVEDGSPAMEAGIKSGDILINVDGTSLEKVSAEEAALLLRGKEGTKVSVRVLRGGSNQLDFTIIRRPITLKGVASTVKVVKGKNVAVVSVRSFSGTTAGEIQRIFEKLHNSKTEFAGIVLDLRNNGGGLLQGAVETANVFMPPGKIVVFVVSKEGASRVERTLPGTLDSTDTQLPDLETPLYVLINGNTASAAEVLAAALKENDRAKLVGEQSFGKGIIQTVEEVGSTGAGVSVTIAKYETPNHNDINKVYNVCFVMCCSD
jgi:carboxyl-terminal processing protease